MKRYVIIIALILSGVNLFAFQNSAWGNFKKIHYYRSLNNPRMVRMHLERIRDRGLNRQERNVLSQHLTALGDVYLKENNFSQARMFYRKALEISNRDWRIFSSLNKTSAREGSIIPDFKLMARQSLMLVKNFSSSFVLVNRILSAIILAIMGVIGIFSFFFLFKYFKLVTHDLFFEKNAKLNLPKIFLALLLLFWPAFILSGWAIYPFLITGFLWKYLEKTEKRAVFWGIAIFAAATIIFSFNVLLTRRHNSADFLRSARIHSGKIASDTDSAKLDNQLKIWRAFSLYELNKTDLALDLINSTGTDYQSLEKFKLLGNIYFKNDDIEQSIKNFRMALRFDDKDPVALNNFAMSLLRSDNPKIFESYAKRYPQIKEIKNRRLTLKNSVPEDSMLWKRLLDDSKTSFSLPGFLKNYLLTMLKMPALYYILLFIIYLYVVPRFFRGIGESTFCSKCKKIIKKSSIHRSYHLCSDCYQLFMIKDIVFLEAKVLKEKELNAVTRRRKMKVMALSFLFPGIILLFKEKYIRYLCMSSVFYFLAIGSFLLASVFKNSFSVIPMAVNFLAVLSLVWYGFLNIYSLKGEENGF